MQTIANGWQEAKNIADWLDGNLWDSARRQIDRSEQRMRELGPFQVHRVLYSETEFNYGVVGPRNSKGVYLVIRSFEDRDTAQRIANELNEIYFGDGYYSNLEERKIGNEEFSSDKSGADDECDSGQGSRDEQDTPLPPEVNPGSSGASGEPNTRGSSRDD